MEKAELGVGAGGGGWAVWPEVEEGHGGGRGGGEWAAWPEPEPEVEGGGWPELGRVGLESLSFRTCSSAPSSPTSVRSLSLDLRDYFAPMSEYEEIPSRRWLSQLESPLHTREGPGQPPATTLAKPQKVGEEEAKKPSSRRWLLPPFLRPRSAFAAGSDVGGGGGWSKDKDPLLQYRHLGRYAFGDFSMAVVQANSVLEDYCQLESGPFGAFAGVYDGHGGPEAARYVCDHLYRHFRELSSDRLGISSEAIEIAFLQTDEDFTSMVAEQWESHPRLATVGSCCLVSVICDQTLYVANLGDSRAVLGRKSGNKGELIAVQLSTEHNVHLESVRQELSAQNPDDPQIVVFKHGVWRVKGIIQVSRSIGDVNMKHAEYNREPLPERFRLSGPMNMPILSAKPTVISHSLQLNDSFVILASDGLWEHLANQEAVDIVHGHPNAGAASRLLKAALKEAARKRDIKYSDVQRFDKGIRRHFHDDITAIVLFFNHNLISGGAAQARSLSIRTPLH